MATRRINFTNRIRLHKEHIQLICSRGEANDLLLSISASLDSYGLPLGSKVFLEVRRPLMWVRRLDLGSIGQLQLIGDFKLLNLSETDSVTFRLIVVSSGQNRGMLLAAADNLYPARSEISSDNRVPLLPVKVDASLAQQLFRVDLSGSPVLLVNKNIPNPASVITGPLVASTILPSVLTQVLTHALLVLKDFDYEDHEDWRYLWVRFSESIPGVPRYLDLGDEIEEIREWIDEVVMGFCRKKRFLDTFVRTLSEGDLI